MIDQSGRAGDKLVVVFAGGDAPTAGALDGLGGAAVVVAADSGLRHAQAAGVVPDVVVGDFDSVDPEALAVAAEAGAQIDRHDTAKDQTDLELALEHSLAAGASKVVVLGAGGGRLDHLLANALLLAAPRFAALDIEAREGEARLHVVRGRPLDLDGRPGDLVTLLALAGPAAGVTTTGLLYPLTGETLRPGSTRGVSNELSRSSARVEVERGVLLVVLPGQRGTHADPSLHRPEPGAVR